MYPIAVEEITNADIPHATRTNALRLLRCAHPDNGHVAITWQDATALCEVSQATLRRQLGQMSAAHLLHYSSNGDGYVYCTFKAWIRHEVSNFSTVDARGRAIAVEKFDSDDQADAQQTRVDARSPSKNSTVDAEKSAPAGTAPIRERARALTERLTDHPIDPEPVSQSVTAPAADERRRTFDLLRAIRIDSTLAQRISSQHPFERVRDCVAAWWMNRKSAGGRLENAPGIVIYWLDAWPEKTPNGYDAAEWRRTDLYRLHRTPAELAAGESGQADQNERVSLYIPDEFVGIANRFVETTDT